jgi:ferritin-like metal-binding protein YciE
MANEELKQQIKALLASEEADLEAKVDAIVDAAGVVAPPVDVEAIKALIAQVQNLIDQIKAKLV